MRRLPFGSAVLLIACSGDAAAPRDTSTTDTQVEVDTTEIEVGPVEFQVALVEAKNVGASPVAFAIAGRIYEDATEAGTTLGECTFYPALPPPFCDPICDIGTICVDDGVCGPPLEPLGAGDIEVTGLHVGLSLHPETQYFYYSPTYTPAEPDDGDLFAAGDTLGATATGGNVPAFSLSVVGVEDLTTPLACPPDLQDGTPLEVRWPAGSADLVHFDLESGNHGGQFARIDCDSPDDGLLVVDAALVDLYLSSSRPLDLWRLVRRNVTDRGVRFSASSEVSCRW